MGVINFVEVVEFNERERASRLSPVFIPNACKLRLFSREEDYVKLNFLLCVDEFTFVPNSNPLNLSSAVILPIRNLCIAGLLPLLFLDRFY
jgi:hypothetical protein